MREETRIQGDVGERVAGREGMAWGEVARGRGEEEMVKGFGSLGYGG